MCNDKTSFEKLLETDRSLTINIRKRQALTTEIFVNRDLAPSIL